MNIKGYDAWKLEGPPEIIEPVVETCVKCRGIGQWLDEEGFPQECDDCGGSGEYEVPQDEPDGDYLRDLRMDQ